MRLCIVLLGLTSLLPIPALAQDGKKADKKEEAPTPRVWSAPVITLEVLLPPVITDRGTPEIWNSYAVDQTGRWRPRVVLSPYGSYYYGTGEMYPWTTTRPRSIKQFVQ
jgi:hypothetical protein